jgi:HEAT repeat protein
MRRPLALLLLLVAACARSEADWIGKLASPDPFERVLAVTALAQGGRPDLLARVLDALNDPDEQVRAAAGAALARLGEQAAPPLILGLLPDAPARDRERAMDTLPLLGDAAAAPLAEALLDGKHDKLAIFSLLERIGPQAGRPALPAFLKALQEPGDSGRRAVAAEGLRAVDPTDHDVLLVLIQVARDPDDTVRDAALMAAVTGLLARERLPDGVARAAAQAQLETLGPAALPALARALREAETPDQEVGPLAVLATYGVAALGPAFDALNPRDPRHVDRAGRLAVALGADALPQLLAFLDGHDVQRRLLAMVALGELKSLAAPAVPRLLDEVDGNEPLARWGAGHALGLIGPQDDAQLARMLKASAGADGILRQQLVPGLVPALLARIDDRPAESAAWRAKLDALGPDTWPTLQSVVDTVGPHAATAAAILAARPEPTH